MRRYFFYSAYLFVLICVILTIIAWPHRFQKWNSIKSEAGIQGISREISSKKSLDVSHFIGSIPYQADPQFVYSVLPSMKYRKTIIEGHGDCSHLSYGASYYLLKQKIGFEVIHFLPPDSFLDGEGHVALRVPYTLSNREIVGVIDLAEGGVPQRNGIALDIADLMNPDNSDISVLSLTERRDSTSPYYQRKYLNNVFLGWTPSNEIDRYFEFIETVFIDFRNEKAEKYFFDGLALLLGYYYHIYVAPNFFEEHQFERAFFIFILWFIRVTIILLPIAVWHELRQRRKHLLVPKKFR